MWSDSDEDIDFNIHVHIDADENYQNHLRYMEENINYLIAQRNAQNHSLQSQLAPYRSVGDAISTAVSTSSIPPSVETPNNSASSSYTNSSTSSAFSSSTNAQNSGADNSAGSSIYNPLFAELMGNPSINSTSNPTVIFSSVTYSGDVSNVPHDSLFANFSNFGSMGESFQTYLSNALQQSFAEQESLQRNPNIELNVTEKDFSQTSKRFTQCSICSDDFSDTSKVCELDCGHIFDTVCIQEWGKYKQECPICKREISTK